MLVGVVVGFVLGCVVTGVVAHRFPSLFNKAVAAANTVDAKANAAVSSAAQSVSKKV